MYAQLGHSVLTSKQQLFVEATAIEDEKKTIPAMLYLLALGADINWRNVHQHGASVAHIAAAAANLEVVEFLLNNDANINQTDDRNWTPLHYAVVSDDPGMVKLLIKRGSKVSVKDIFGKTPYDLAVDHGCSRVTFIKQLLEVVPPLDDESESNEPSIQPSTRDRRSKLNPFRHVKSKPSIG